MRVKLSFSSSETDIDYEVDWKYPVLPSVGDYMFNMANTYVDNNIPNEVWGSYEIVVHSRHFEDDAKGIFLILMLDCS